MPFSVNRLAPAFAERQVLIAAPRERVWELLSGIDDWPRWQSGVSKARLEGPLSIGTSFRWKASGMRITSKLTAVTPPIRLSWEGKAVGLCARHGWYLYRRGDDTLVLTAESFEGPLARLFKPVMQRVVTRTLAASLTDLRREAENSRMQ